MPLLGDHPHACGDKFTWRWVGFRAQGSSPRVWGQALVTAYFDIEGRIIPTRVGTRAIAPDNALGCKDHPHACGDKAKFNAKRNVEVGSSPRVWGQDIAVICISCAARIIPTRVGTRISTVVVTKLRGDHPHACGDKEPIGMYIGLRSGSSPRVWGQACHATIVWTMIRIIPTRVGTRALKSLDCQTAWDHPHACGDKNRRR